jgi:hypothetical protein
MTSSKVSPIFNTFAGAAEFYTQEQCGTLMLKATQYTELLSAVLAKLNELYTGTQNKSETPSKVFGNHVLAEFTRLDFDNLSVKCDALQEFESEEFGFILRSQLGKITHRKKGEFDGSYDIHFTEMDQSLEDTRLFTMIKALRLYTAELFKRLVGSYDPADFDSARVTYSVGGAKRSSEFFMTYAQQLYEIHFGFCKYSEKLTEFSDIFKTAAGLSKALSEKLKTERESKRHVKTDTKTDSKTTSKTDTKTTSKTGKPYKTGKTASASADVPPPLPPKTHRVFTKSEAGKIVVVPAPPASVWAKRSAEHKVKQETAAAAEAAEATEATEAAEAAETDETDEADEADEAAETDSVQVPEKDEEFKVVVSKRINKKQETSTSTSTKGRRFRKE